MKAFNKSLFAALVTMGMLGVAGCGAENESEGEKLAKKEADPGKPAAGSIPTKIEAPPRTNAERGQRSAPTGSGAAPNYPGQKK